MTMQNRHDANVHILHLIDNGFYHANLIPQFPLKHIMVNVLLHRCCVARIVLRRKLDRRAVVHIFRIWSIGTQQLDFLGNYQYRFDFLDNMHKKARGLK